MAVEMVPTDLERLPGTGTDAPAEAANLPMGESAGHKFRSSALYVGDLDHDVQETDLFELFNEFGPVHSVRVCRDAVTRRSLGYAYVNLNTTLNPEAANTAKTKLNYHVLNGKAIRIMWATKNARNRVNSSGNIFVKNLRKTITTRELHDTFAVFGEILSCKVAVDKDGHSKGYGFVHFSEPAAAKEAIRDVNRAQLGDSDKTITVTEYLSKEDRVDPRQLFTNVYAKNLPDSIRTEVDVKAMFAEYGDISSVALMKTSPDQDTGNCFVFVDFATHNAAAAACDALHEKYMDGRKLYVARAQTKEERQEVLQRRYEQDCFQAVQPTEGQNIYVKNLDPAIDERTLHSAFSKFGQISSVKIVRDSTTNKSRGFGFVSFVKRSSGEHAVSQMQGCQLGGKQLYVALAQPKALRAEQPQSTRSLNNNVDILYQNPAPSMAVGQHRQNGMGYLAGPFAAGAILPGKSQPRMQQVQQASSTRNYPTLAAPRMCPMMKSRMPMMHMQAPALPRGAQGPNGMGEGIAGMLGRKSMLSVGNADTGRVSAQIPSHQQLRGFLAVSGKSMAGQLAYMPYEDQKQHLGEILFPRLKGMLHARCRSEDVTE
eukprot:jgi/Ulvmu1/7901/UM004_0133.1